MPSERISKINSRMDYEFACHMWGYCPTSKETENSEIKKMANRLKGVSDKETLTNVLEWQDRNLVFWSERWPLFPILFYVLLVMFFFFLYLLLTPNSQAFWWVSQVLWWTIAILGSIATTVFSIIVILLKLIRKIPVWDGFKNTLAPSISINALLRNKLCVCRDYAKLTACLLFNIYPDAEVYFAHAPQHVATGIMVENKLYMLDKQLPIVTIDRWHERWHKHKYSEKRMEKVKGNCLESVNIYSLVSKTKSTEPNTEKLATEMMKLLNIREQATEADLLSLEILRWKNGATLYEDNEIVNYSLARRLKVEIFGAILEPSQIARLGIIQDKNDLTFRISLKSNK
jgi:predicted transglutaminase-like protease